MKYQPKYTTALISQLNEDLPSIIQTIFLMEKRLRIMTHLLETKTEADKIIDKFMTMNFAQLQASIKDPKTPTMELIVATVIMKAVQQGDHTRLSFLFDRLLGKQTENLAIQGSLHNNVLKLIERLRSNGAD